MANGTIHNTVNLTYLLFNTVHNLEREVVEKICIRICVGKERACKMKGLHNTKYLHRRILCQGGIT